MCYFKSYCLLGKPDDRNTVLVMFHSSIKRSSRVRVPKGGSQLFFDFTPFMCVRFTFSSSSPFTSVVLNKGWVKAEWGQDRCTGNISGMLGHGALKMFSHPRKLWYTTPSSTTCLTPVENNVTRNIKKYCTKLCVNEMERYE